MTTPSHRGRKRIHLVCNAHLDPVWQWTWEDGLTEAISTFRVAADFCDEHPGFVFNHNESLLYGWVLKHDPALFRRIQRLVKRGRWHIAGGAYLQPDVNTPGPESHIRQFLHGLKFFKQHFHQRPTTAYNFDPFGHPEGFVQILAGCGMDSYIFCRPDHGTYELPRGAFRWTDRSGAEVIARRSDDHYLTRPGGHHDVDVKLPRFLEHYRDEPVTMILWGIGNHGGGPSRLEWEKLQRYIREHPEYEFLHSTPEAYFDEALRHDTMLPTITGEIERSFAGCYTSMSRVKRAHRAAEHLMLQTERAAALAWWRGLAEYPTQTLDACWRDILFSEFHDILPGSGVPRAEADALSMLGGVNDRLRRLRFDTISFLLRRERPAAQGEVPIFVTNPHGYRVRQPVEIDYTTGWLSSNDKAIVLRDDGRPLTFQRISSDHNLGGQDVVRLVVPLDLGPFETRRIDASLTEGRPMLPRPCKATDRSLTLKSPEGTVRINPRTGLIDSIVPAGGNRSLVRAGAMQPVLFGDLDHSWTCGDPSALDKPQVWSQAPGWKAHEAHFRLATPQEAATLSPLATDKWRPAARTAAEPLRVVEHGTLRTTVEALFVHGPSFINRHYVFCRLSGRLEIRDRVMFNHKDRTLKLALPLGVAPSHSLAESLYSVVRREPTELHEDRHNQRWVAVVGRVAQYLAVINTGSFAHSLTRDALAINVMRSPAYTSFLIQPDDPYNDRRFAPRHDQGEHELRYLLKFGNRIDEAELTRLADALNAEPYGYVYYPPGPATPRRPLARTAAHAPPLTAVPDNLRIVAVKRSECGRQLVVRLQEQSGRDTKGHLLIDGTKRAIQVPAHGLLTLMLSRDTGRLRCAKTNLVEEV